MSYSVGQVLYVALPTARVELVQVVKEVRELTLEGETTSYMVRDASGREVPLVDVGGEVFDNVDVTRRTLVDRAATGIDRTISAAVARAQGAFDTQRRADPGPDAVTVALPDGGIARVVGDAP